MSSKRCTRQYTPYPSFSQPWHLKLPLAPVPGSGAHQVIIGDLQGSHREPSLYKAAFWSVKLANHLCRVSSFASFCIWGKSTADPPFCLLEDLSVLRYGGELFHHLGLAQLGEHLHNKGANEGICLVGKLHPLLVVHRVSVNVRFCPVDMRRFQGCLMQLTFREGLAVNVELEEDKVTPCYLLPRQLGRPCGDQEQLMVGRYDGVQPSVSVGDDWTAYVSLPWVGSSDSELSINVGKRHADCRMSTVGLLIQLAHV